MCNIFQLTLTYFQRRILVTKFPIKKSLDYVVFKMTDSIKVKIKNVYRIIISVYVFVIIK